MAQLVQRFVASAAPEQESLRVGICIIIQRRSNDEPGSGKGDVEHAQG